MMQLQEGARIPSGPKFYSNYREGGKQNCSAHSWSSRWSRLGTTLAWAEGRELSWALWSQSHHQTAATAPTHPHCMPSTQSSCSDVTPGSPPSVHSPNRHLAMGSTGSTAQISPPAGGFQNAKEGWIKSRRDFDELSAAFERNQVGFAAEGLLVHGNAESRIVHALNTIATIISDLHWNEFAND